MIDLVAPFLIDILPFKIFPQKNNRKILNREFTIIILVIFFFRNIE